MRFKDIKGKSTINRVNRNCDSLKTTIPKSIIDILGIKPGDQLMWTAYMKEGMVRVEPVISNGNNGGGG